MSMFIRWAAAAGVLWWCTACPSYGLAQAIPSATETDAVTKQSLPDEKRSPPGVHGMPSWLRLGIEVRGRAELNIDAEQETDERFYSNRLRISVGVQPARRMRFYFEGQDTRPLGLNPGPALDGQWNAFDVRQGYIEFGNAERGFQARAGRQELSVGDERLIGADHDWDPFGQSFDAIQMAFTGDRLRVEAFTGLRAEPAGRRPDHWDKSSRISGLSARFKTGMGDGQIEPYLLWKRGGDTLDLVGRPGHRDVATPGLRAQGDLTARLDFNFEMALQRGHVVRDQIAAWGGHWEIGWKPLGGDTGARVGIEYNHASGDADPEDGRHQTFDDLYPAGFNTYGIMDPYAWRNIRYPAVGVEVPLTRRWTLYGAWRSYWLATIRDGLYPGGDSYLVRNPGATTSHIGSQVFFSAAFVHSRRWSVHAGYGHLFSGGYLR